MSETTPVCGAPLATRDAILASLTQTKVSTLASQPGGGRLVDLSLSLAAQDSEMDFCSVRPRLVDGVS